MNHIKNYLSLIKFSHTIFAMPFALIGFFLGLVEQRHLAGLSLFGDGQWNLNKTVAWTIPNQLTGTENLFVIFILVIFCMVFARSAAMAFNRYLDRRWDALNPRTAIREIPRGIITPKNALAFTIINCVLFVATTFFINTICFFLSPVALAVVLGYSYTKRFTRSEEHTS